MTERKTPAKLSRERMFAAMVDEAEEFFRTCRGSMLQGRQWLANAYAEIVELRDITAILKLTQRTDPPLKTIELLKAMKDRHRETVTRLKLLEYQLATYEQYFPWLVDYREAILDDQIPVSGQSDEDGGEDAKRDPALVFGLLGDDEFSDLTSRQKFQLALDRYWERNKSDREIGRVYERYIGYLYEQDGWDVEYHGIVHGYEDLGRDLVCRRNENTLVVQCKCWSQSKTIHEKHLFQLFGTVVLARIEQESASRQRTLFDRDTEATGVFVSTTTLSDVAEKAARLLKIEVRKIPLARWPMIKCNAKSQMGDRIYHLPFDQQYDRFSICRTAGDQYAETVEEAENLGFRRAFRWSGAPSKVRG